ncbi:MAG: thioredoxin domain-containing protein [Deltaproteobacteria bacterium]|nr:thioredoxin domain-containing protein [Deltaproteobacteria bacterium]
MGNELIHEKSPYLLQHAHNPVDWRAWNEATLQGAKQHNRLIFLSIGYATCHWCHVMEHESFEDHAVAKVLNENFVCIKVDREELPDVDQIYMDAVHAMGQRGGWPLNVFLTPDLYPFFGGTYFPKANFIRVLQKIAENWQQNPAEIKQAGRELVRHLKTDVIANPVIPGLAPGSMADCLHLGFQQLKSSYDPHSGGFSLAPKFPTGMKINFLLRYHQQFKEPHALEMATKTLECMARGGIYDHLGGGFARYSTDQRWLVPHFEKMLYDNAILAIAYLEAYQATQAKDFAKIAQETLDYVLRKLHHPEGGFYCAEDADSEGVEGKFYVWSEQEIQAALTAEEFALFKKVYGVTKEGNWEGENILNLQSEFDWAIKADPKLKSAQAKLFQLREKRVHPLRDDKILTSWNGLMISAMALGARVLGEEKYLQAAIQAAQFIKTQRHPGPGAGIHDSELFRRWRDGEAKYLGTLEDYAFLIFGLLELYVTSHDEQWFSWALALQKKQDELFLDEKNGGYFFSRANDPHLITRKKEGFDNAMPSGNSVAAMNLLKFFGYTCETKYQQQFEGIIKAFYKQFSEIPIAFTELLLACHFYLNQPKSCQVPMVHPHP